MKKNYLLNNKNIKYKYVVMVMAIVEEFTREASYDLILVNSKCFFSVSCHLFQSFNASKTITHSIMNQNCPFRFSLRSMVFLQLLPHFCKAICFIVVVFIDWNVFLTKIWALWLYVWSKNVCENLNKNTWMQ